MDYSKLSQDTRILQNLIDYLDYLDTYGGEQFIRVYKKEGEKHGYHSSIYYGDYTNDGVPEIIIELLEKQVNTMYILGCVDGRYDILYKQGEYDGYLSAYSIEDIRDGNHNGIPELVFLTERMSQGGHFFEMYEWNGSEFESLLSTAGDENEDGDDSIFVEVTGKVFYRNIDKDPVDEFIVDSGIPKWETYYSGLPYRNIRFFYKWDGSRYRFLKQEIAPPVFRFQAVHDADLLAEQGEYDRALEMYQQVIYNEDLQWWSAARLDYMRKYWDAEIWNSPYPPLPPKDPLEYPYQAAYARYRIMLLHVLRGRDADAKTVYDTLQKYFPEGKPGSVYASLARTFWNEYQGSKDMGRACAKAVGLVDPMWDDSLTYIGNHAYGDISYGWQGRGYEAKDLCPYK